MTQHEHDGGGCIETVQCGCQASAMNSYPCTCPLACRGELERPRQQPIRLMQRGTEREVIIGEMNTVVRHGSAVVCVVIRDEYQYVLDDMQFGVYMYGHPVLPAQPIDIEDNPNIIRSEN